MKTSKLNIGVISLFPGMFDALNQGITGRAQAREILRLRIWDPRSYSNDRHGRVDDRPYGGGPGMVMAVQPLQDAIYDAKRHLGENTLTVYLSPQGETVNQQKLNAFVTAPRPLLLVAGRYEGIDERLIDSDIDEQWSLGDFVLSGGELAAMAIIDGLNRLMPGVLGSEESKIQDSFMDGLLEHPHYTRPESFDGRNVPEVLLSGDHQAITRWRKKQTLGRTWLKRPDLLKKRPLDDSEQQLLNEFKLEKCEELL